MRLLVPLTFAVDDLAHGRNLRVVQLLRQMHKRADLTVVAPSLDIAAGIRSHDSSIHTVVASSRDQIHQQARGLNQRCIAFHNAAPHIASAVTELATQYDAVLGFGLGSLDALIQAKTHPTHPPVLIDVIDDPWLTWQSLPIRDRLSLSGLKACFVAWRLRQSVLPGLAQVLTAGTRDAVALKQAGIDAVTCIPNGVDLAPESSISDVREPLAVFTGFMSFPPNEQAALYLLKSLWPQIRTALLEQGRGSVQLALVGAEPTARIRRAARTQHVFITGRVPSVRDWLLRAQLAIVPMLSGCGIKNKVLEALACGCPVVSTPSGASGLPTGSQYGVQVADSTRGLAAHCCRLLASPEQAALLGRQGYRTVSQQFTWSLMADRLLEVIQLQIDAGNGQERLNQHIASTQPENPKEALLDATS